LRRESTPAEGEAVSEAASEEQEAEDLLLDSVAVEAVRVEGSEDSEEAEADPEATEVDLEATEVDPEASEVDPEASEEVTELDLEAEEAEEEEAEEDLEEDISKEDTNREDTNREDINKEDINNKAESFNHTELEDSREISLDKGKYITPNSISQLKLN